VHLIRFKANKFALDKIKFPHAHNLCRDSDLNLDTRLQADAGDLLNDLARRVQVNQTFVNFELVAIPSLRAFTTRSLACGDLQNLGRKTDRALDTKLLVLGSVNEIS